jgi:hypothetical protein
MHEMHTMQGLEYRTAPRLTWQEGEPQGRRLLACDGVG